MSAQCRTVLVHLMLMTRGLIVVSSTIQLQSPLHLGEALVGSRLRAGESLALSPLSHRPVVVSSTQPRLSLRVLPRLWVEGVKR